MADIATIGLKVDSKGVVRATKDLDRMGKEGNKTVATAQKLGRAFGALAGALAGGALFRGVIQATIEQERVTAQLDQTLRSTGRYTPELSQQMQDYASSLQQVTTFGDEAIIGAQAMLLTFTQIGNETFPRAQEAILDVATAMGTDLKSATIQVGKALNDPIRGVTALAESGIQFTDAQRDMIKEMVETNRVADAQALILNELEVQFGGSARAARDTLGGAITSLKNAFGDLLEGDSGGDGVRGATEAINNLTDRLSSSEVQNAFASITTAILAIAEAATTAAVKFVELGTKIGEGLARAIVGPIAGTRDAVETEISEIESRLEQLQSELTRPRLLRVNPFESTEEMGQEYDQLRSRLAVLKGLLQEINQESSAINLSELAKGLPSSIPSLNLGSVGGNGGGGGGSGSSSNTPDDPFGPTINFPAPEEFTERNLIMERYSELLQESDRIAESVKSPQQLFQEEIQLLNELRETTNITNGQRLLSTEQYVAAVEDAQDRLSQSTQETATEMSEFMKEAAGQIQNVLADNLFDFMQGEFDFTGDSFKRMIDRMVADAAAAKIAETLFGGLLGGSAEGTGLIGKAFSGAASFLGLGGARADGGPVDANKTYLVGERGPELITPRQSGTVIPNNQMQAAGGMNITVNISGVRDGRDIRQSADQAAMKLMAAGQRAMQRNG